MEGRSKDGTDGGVLTARGSEGGGELLREEGRGAGRQGDGDSLIDSTENPRSSPRSKGNERLAMHRSDGIDRGGLPLKSYDRVTDEIFCWMFTGVTEVCYLETIISTIPDRSSTFVRLIKNESMLQRR